MKLPRRNFLHLAASAAALPVVSRFAWAQAYPARPVRVIVPSSAGSATDIAARLMGQWLSERLGQPFIVENRVGAGGNVGTEMVVRSAPDGYTLLMVNGANAISATPYENLNFNFIRDIAPVASVMRTPVVMEVHPSVPANTVPEFIAPAQANPGKIAMASAGNGSIHHVAGELFKMMARIDLLHVPYRGAPPALTDLIAGQVQVIFDVLPSSIGYIRAGKLRALAVTTAARLEILPDIPTVSEFVPDYDARRWIGVGTTKHTPTTIFNKLNKEINAALADPKIRARITDLGSPVFASSPAEFANFIAAETEKWGKVVKFARIEPQ